ncbi:VOC family protein [Pseudomonas sp. CCC3.1]|uniref:VOC family protein n=1 Tax=Pseudomonas sp. CCC3.1 TaxID=3048607 RepID=UPI002AC9B1E7|nr:VOC family protein [Pseudomonas sp. CCC3.1]MEB0204629.1 VOC family protein [Pseudomonas sp. CCC3.1]WPX38674.1 VOC family protein [Pseudomonas sp. CCC3.1]
MTVSRNDRQIDNIEFNVADIERSKDFYGGAFGWTFVDYGPTYTEFSDGRLTGGFTTGEPVRPGGPLIILYAQDLEATQLRLKALGAVISRETFSFPGGSRFHFIDPDGYELAVWTSQD